MVDITINQLTYDEARDSNAGVFDALMDSVDKRIEAQHKKSRITGADYATVYLGSLTAVLSESIKFVLGEQEAQKRAELLDEQIKSELKNNEAGGVIDLQKKQLQEQIDLVVAQTAQAYEAIDNSRQETVRANSLNAQNVIKVGKEALLLTSQNSELLLNGTSERALRSEQTLKTTQDKDNATNKTNAEVAVLNAEKLKIDAEELSIDATTSRTNADKLRIDNEAANIAGDTLKKAAETTLLGTQNTVATNQASKLSEETSLLTQKILTEKAQTSDTASNYTGLNDIGGVLGAQKDLYNFQKKGIEGKYKVDSLKTLLDSWGLMFSISDGAMQGTDYVMPDILLGTTAAGYASDANLDSVVTAMVNHTFA